MSIPAPAAVIQMVEGFVDGSFADAAKSEHSSLLDADNVRELHDVAADIYALGYDDGARSARERAQRQAYRDRPKS